MTDDFVAPEVAQERMSRLVEVVERHALAQARGARRPHRGGARRGAVEEGSRRCGRAAPARTSSCTSSPGVHEPAVGGGGRRPHHPRRAALAARRPARDGARAPSGPPPHPRHRRACVTAPHLALVGPTAFGQVGARARGGTGARRRRDRVARLDAGLPRASTSARPSRRPPSAPRSRTTSSTSPTRATSGRCARVPGRGTRRDRRHRGARAARAARRRHRPVRAGGGRPAHHPAARTATVRDASLDAVTATPEGLAAAYAELQRVDPAAAARIEPGNAPAGRARARGDRDHRATVLVVRSRPPGVRAPGVPGRASPASWLPRAGPGRPHRATGSRRCAPPASSTRCAASQRAERCRAPPGRRSATGRCWPTSTARSPSLDDAFDLAAVAAPGSSPAASACGSAATPGSGGSGRPGIRARSSPRSWQAGAHERPSGCRSCTPRGTTSSSGRGCSTHAGVAGHRRRAGRGAVRSPPRHRRRRPDHDQARRRRRRRTRWCSTTPTAGVAEMSGNGMRCLAWVAARAGLGRDGTPHRRHRAGRRAVDARPRDAGTATWSRPTVDMGPVTFDPARIPLAAPSPFDLRADVPRHALRGRRRRNGQPAPRAVRRRPRHRPGHPARSAPRARRPVPTPHQRRVRRASPPAPTTSSTCGSGSAGWARR